MPQVLNKVKHGVPEGAVYVGRPSPYGNPYTEAQYGRERACERFEKWLRGNRPLMQLVRQELRGKDLVCWCAPKQCHADILLKIANE